MHEPLAQRDAIQEPGSVTYQEADSVSNQESDHDAGHEPDPGPDSLSGCEPNSDSGR